MRLIFQIELTNICNRCCSYCGQTKMTREKGFMSDEVVNRCIEVLRDLKQETVGITHYGESLLHPRIFPIIERFNLAGISPYLYTNGDPLTEEYMDALAFYNICYIVVSGHDANDSKRLDLVSQLRSRNIVAYSQVHVEPLALTIAGQIGLPNRADKESPLIDPSRKCRFLASDYAIVLYNGDLVPCCYDFDGVGVFGNILDNACLLASPRPYRLCRTCPGHPGNVIED